jgi:hypothetical protein
MGEFLSTPIKEKVSNDGENSIVSNKYKINYSINIVKIWFM